MSATYLCWDKAENSKIKKENSWQVKTCPYYKRCSFFSYCSSFFIVNLNIIFYVLWTLIIIKIEESKPLYNCSEKSSYFKKIQKSPRKKTMREFFLLKLQVFCWRFFAEVLNPCAQSVISFQHRLKYEIRNKFVVFLSILKLRHKT